MVKDMQKHLDCLKTVIGKLPDQGWKQEKAGLSALLTELEKRKSMDEVFIEGSCYKESVVQKAEDIKALMTRLESKAE
jgi:hypothetical protein